MSKPTVDAAVNAYFVLDLVVWPSVELVDDPTRILFHRLRELFLQLTLIQCELSLERLHVALDSGLPVLKQLVLERL